MLKIVHADFDPSSSTYVVAFTGERLVEQVFHGAQLRCAGYRFAVDEVVASHLDQPIPSIVARLLGDESPQLGMVVHPANAPLTDEEMAAAVRHLLMIPRMLKAVDALGALRRLAKSADIGNPEVRIAAIQLENVALQVSRILNALPTDRAMQQAERFASEVLQAC